ncbi:MAG: prenyltransferase [Candidatus Aminicenantes bacterium]|nr:prenyltransferase [Candidatus Aminicenantes bacterium]
MNDRPLPSPSPPSSIRKWAVAARPWALPASTMPVLFGTSLAVVAGGARLDPLRFLLALAAMMILHSAANMLSDVHDFRRGLDREVTPVSGAIVRCWLTDKAVERGAYVLFGLGVALGLLLAGLTGVVLLAIGGVGVLIGFFYSALKSHAWGDFAVFMDFGILGGLGAWVVQSRAFDWRPVVWTVPMAMLVIAILHANNWRDTASDAERRVRTVASLLGDRGSFAYYGFLIFGSMALALLFVAGPRFFPGWGLPALPWTSAVVLLGFPTALALWGRAKRRRAPRRPLDFIILDGATAQYNLVFGLLYTAGLWLDFLIRLIRK